MMRYDKYIKLYNSLNTTHCKNNYIHIVLSLSWSVVSSTDDDNNNDDDDDNNCTVHTGSLSLSSSSISIPFILDVDVCCILCFGDSDMGALMYI